MKNYAVSLNMQEDFILKYTVINNTIAVFMADSTIKIFPYSKNKEIELLKVMEEQYSNINIDELIRNKNANLILSILMPISSAIELKDALTSKSNFANYIILLFLLTGALGNIISCKDREELIRDYKKMTYFFENKAFFEENYNLNINLIDSISLSKLKKIKDNNSPKKRYLNLL